MSRVSSDLFEGPVSDGLVNHAKVVTADLVLMTTHVGGSLQRFWMGSFADALMWRLLLVRLGDEPVAEVVDSLPRHALELGRLSGAVCTLLRVVAPVSGLRCDLMDYAAGGADVPVNEALRLEALIYLKKIEALLRAKDSLFTRGLWPKS